MAYPVGGYRNAADKRVRGVGTILSPWKPGGEGLLIWSNALGQQGIDHRDERRKAASLGTLVHLMIHAYLDEYWFPSLKYALAHGCTRAQYKLGLIGFTAATSWLNGINLRVVEQESPIISEEYQCVGIPDLIGSLPDSKENEFALWDWKIGKQVIYTDHIYQLSAYRRLWEDENPGKKITTVYLGLINKETGEFDPRLIPLEVIDQAWEGFKHLLAMYRIDQELNKKLKKKAV